MAARPSSRGQGRHPGLTAYEIEREDRIKQNKAKLIELGVLQQKTLFEAAFKVVKKPTSERKKKIKEKGLAPERSSSRLLGTAPENQGLTDDFTDGLQELPKLKCSSEKEWTDSLKERRCDSQGRGSLYDSKVGITCHFCRQKKLCGEPDCPRCSERDPELKCIGKSECSKCASANGRFCRACLMIRYGYELDEVRQQMVKGTWLCPHCYEEEHPDEGWICNSSICMTRRGLKPTGIAIYEAQERGFVSVGHYLQARLRKDKESSSEQSTPAGNQVAAEKEKKQAEEEPAAHVRSKAKSSKGTKEAAAAAAEQTEASVKDAVQKDLVSLKTAPKAAAVETLPRRSARLQPASTK